MIAKLIDMHTIMVVNNNSHHLILWLSFIYSYIIVT